MTRPGVHKSVAAGTLAVLFLVAGCGTPRPGISNGSVSACYRAIPAARAAIHDSHATVVGVHRVPADRVKDRLSPDAQSDLAGDNDTQVCTIAFKGMFSPGQVDLAPSTEVGRYALVLIASRNLHLLGSAVLDQLPPSLGKRTI